MPYLLNCAANQNQVFTPTIIWQQSNTQTYALHFIYIWYKYFNTRSYWFFPIRSFWLFDSNVFLWGMIDRRGNPGLQKQLDSFCLLPLHQFFFFFFPACSRSAPTLVLMSAINTAIDSKLGPDFLRSRCLYRIDKRGETVPALMLGNCHTRKTCTLLYLRPIICITSKYLFHIEPTIFTAELRLLLWKPRNKHESIA